MTKSVEYEIKLLDSPSNRAALQGLQAAFKGSIQDIEASISRIGDAMQANSRVSVAAATPDYSKQLAALDRFRQEADAKFEEAGRSARRRFEDSIGGLAPGMRSTGESAGRQFSDGFNDALDVGAQKARQAGQERGNAYRQGFKESLGQMTGMSGADLDTLAGADQNRSGKSGSMAAYLGMTGDQANELFGAKGGSDLAKQQEDFRTAQQASLEMIGANLDKLDELEEQGKNTSRALSANFREIAERAEAGAGGLAQLASGIGFLFADSKDAKVLIDTLLTIKGTADVVLGTFKSFSGAMQIFTLLTDRTEMQTKQQKDQAAATRLTQQATLEYVRMLDREGIALEEVTKGNLEHARALREVANAAERAAREERDLNNEQSRGGDGGLGSRVTERATASRRGRAGRSGLIGSVMSSVGYAGVNMASNAVGDRSGIIDSVGDAGLDMLTSGRGGMRAGSVLRYAKVGGAVASAAALGKLGYDIAAGGGTIDPNSGSGQVLGAVGRNAIGGSVDRFLGLDTPAARLTKSFEELEKTTKQYEAAQKARTLAEVDSENKQIERRAANQLTDFRMAADSRVQSLSVANRDLGAVDAVRDNSVNTATKLAEQLKIIKDEQEGLVHDARAYTDALNRANEFFDQQIANQEAMVAAVKQEAEERKRLNGESISAAEQRISLIEREKGMYQSAEQKIEAAAQKFARMSDEERFKVTRAQETLQSGGKLTREQRAALESVGLGAESAGVKKQDLEDARKAGFFDKFGSFEKSQMAGSLSRADQLSRIQAEADAIGDSGSIKEREEKLRALNRAQEAIGLQQQTASRTTAEGQSAGERRFDAQSQAVRVEIQGRRDFTVKLEADTEATVRAVVREMESLIRQQEENLQRMVAEQIQNEKTARKAEADQRQAQAIAARNAKA